MPMPATGITCSYHPFTGCGGKVNNPGNLCVPCRKVYAEIRRTVNAVLRPPPKEQVRVRRVVKAPRVRGATGAD